MSEALKFLLDREWSMGNGQCPDCCGVPESWFGHPLHLGPESIGHNLDCKSAAAIKEIGGAVIYKGEFKSDKRYELDWSSGFLDTRLRAPNSALGTRE